jgi:hypothetical protein
MNFIKNLVLISMAIVMLAGCATTSSNAPVPPVPPGCENALVYTKIPGFMPNGPMITRVTVSTALAVAATAGHPEVKLLVATVMPILFRATLTNSLAAAMEDVTGKFKTPQVVNYVTPFLVLFDALAQAGVIQAGGFALTDCDKNVLASLFKNIGLDAGTDPGLFL